MALRHDIAHSGPIRIGVRTEARGAVLRRCGARGRGARRARFPPKRR